MENKIKLKKVLTCHSETGISEVVKKLREHGERRIFVVDDEEKLVGIITTVDIVYKACFDSDLKARDIMSKNVLSIDVDDELTGALEIMDKLKTYVCPITKEGKVIGLISYHDVLAYVMSTM
ncbi:MAG: CBS domain-containing protein [Candidatus Pacearchaeota archaeon]|jgi:CBS domain-containing protein